MTDVAKEPSAWSQSKCSDISLEGLISRNKVAYKWKAPYRSFVLRECVFWRVHDLLTQSDLLYEAQHILGSRILLRSALESIAILVYLNQSTQEVLDKKVDFHTFSETTTRLLLGSKDGSTKHAAINILSVLEKFEKKYTGISHVYATLSESAHPNWEGMCFGYSKVDHEKHESHFSNRWVELWASSHDPLAIALARLFESEYNTVWPSLMEQLEVWIEKNDEKLEATKSRAQTGD